MIVEPATPAVTKPVVGLILATDKLLEDQVPPDVVLLSVVVEPAQSAFDPQIADSAGKPFTVNEAVVEFVHPLPSVTVYVMVAVPALTPVTTPVDAFTVAIAVFEVLQVPPVVALVKVELAPIHAEAVPAIVPALGSAFSVTTVAAEVAAQPLLFVTVTV